MKILGLTGGIATGKTTVSRIFRNKGITIIDADEIAHDSLKTGSLGYLLVKHFLNPSLNQDQSINRQSLGLVIFTDEKKRKKLNSILHPIIIGKILWRILISALKLEKLIVLDAPLLIECKLHWIVNYVVVVYCSEEKQLQRLMTRNNLNESEARDRIQSQISLDQKIRYADKVIDNDSERREDLMPQIEHILETQMPVLVHRLLFNPYTLTVFCLYLYFRIK